MLPDAYGCVVANRFGDLLDDNADPYDLLCEAETEKDKLKKKKKPGEEKKAKQKKPGQKESQRDRRVRQQEPVPVSKQQPKQTHPGPVTESKDAKEEAPRSMRRAAAAGGGGGQRRPNQEESPQEFSVPKLEEEEDAEMVVQVAVQMTLDEWKSLQEMSRPKTEFNIRKAENAIPSKAKVIHQSKQVEIIKGVEDMDAEGNFLRRHVNDITSVLEINFGNLERPARGGRGRGARGGATSRPERVKPVVEKADPLAPNPDDPDDFPALCAGN